MHTLVLFASSAVLSLLLASPGQGGPHQGGDKPPRPPREAVEACAELQSGDACSFEGREGDAVSGACFSPDADKPLACRPKGGPGQGR